jgi:hypothetical protein
MNTKRQFGFFALLLAIAVAVPAFAYEYPLSLDSIREAYFLGSGQKSKEADFYDRYSHSLGDAKHDPPGSIITIDTPYLQVAEHSRDTANYHAQDAERDFFGKPLEFRVFLDIYYKPVKPRTSDSPNGIGVRLIQKKKDIAWRTVERQPLLPFHDAYTSAERDGEYLEIACDAAKIDSSVLTIVVDTPDGGQLKTQFDLAEIK